MDKEYRFGGAFGDFIAAHMEDDPDRLALSKGKWAGIDVAAAASTIAGRRKTAAKLPTWHADPLLVYPTRLSAEQCSSEATALYKARLLTRLATRPGGPGAKPGQHPADPAAQLQPGARLADLTSGLGVDDWAFARSGFAVLYNDASPLLRDAAIHNFARLGIHAEFRCEEVAPGKVAEILAGFRPDIIYMDPARRESGTGRKTFRLADCSPDVLALAPELRALGTDILLKLSPMADISAIVSELDTAFGSASDTAFGSDAPSATPSAHHQADISMEPFPATNSLCVREIHIVEYDGECKEVLVWLSRRGDTPKLTVAICGTETATLTAELGAESALTPELYRAPIPGTQSTEPLGSRISQQSAHLDSAAQPNAVPASQKYAPHGAACGLEGACLFEPGKAISKSGLFKTLGRRFGLSQLGLSTHLYVSPEPVEALKPFGKTYRITTALPLSSQNIKELSRKGLTATLSVRNVPLTAPELTRRLRLKPSPSHHIFACHIDTLSANYLLFTQPFFI